jgi:hypothetical protein
VRRCWMVDGAMIDGVRFESCGRFRLVSISFLRPPNTICGEGYFLCTMQGSEDVLKNQGNVVEVHSRCTERLTRILRNLGVLLPKTADLQRSSSAGEMPLLQPLSSTTSNKIKHGRYLDGKLNHMWCYQRLWYIEKAIMPVRYSLLFDGVSMES